MQILIEFDEDRNLCGKLYLLTDTGELIAGPFPAAGRASDDLAARHGNPHRKALMPYGDTPLGQYRLAQPVLDEQRFPKSEFGPHGIVPLLPAKGEAARADACGRFSMALFGGPPGPQGRLRSTAGGVRLADANLAQLLKAMAGPLLPICEIVAKNSAKGADPAGAKGKTFPRVWPDANCTHVDPLLPAQIHSPVTAPSAARPAWSRTTSALALGATISLATLPVQADAFVRHDGSASWGTAWRPTARSVVFEALVEADYDATPMAYNPPPPQETSATPAIPTPAPQEPAGSNPGIASPDVSQPDGANTPQVETETAVQHIYSEPLETFYEAVRDAGSETKKEALEKPDEAVEALHRVAEHMADKEEAPQWNPIIDTLNETDRDFHPSGWDKVATGLEFTSNTLKVVSAWDHGKKIGNAINDLNDGKMDWPTFVQKVGPEPAKILLSAADKIPGIDKVPAIQTLPKVPFTDRVVDLSLATVNLGIGLTMNAGFYLYDKAHGLDPVYVHTQNPESAVHRTDKDKP